MSDPASDPAPATSPRRTFPAWAAAKPDAVISRIRMTVRKVRVAQRHIDFYESYWAPITAGKVNVLDALMFLVNAGRAGILRSFSPDFIRYFWSGTQAFRLPRRSNIAALGGVLLLVLSLAFLTARSLSALHDLEWRARLEELSVFFRSLHLLVFPTLLTYLIHTWKKSGWTQRGGLGLGFLLGIVQLPWIFMPDRWFKGSWITRNISVQEPLIVHAFQIMLGLTALSIVIVSARVLFSMKPEVRASYNGQLIWSQSLLIGMAILAAAGGPFT